MTQIYKTGTATVSNGSTSVVGDDTAWQTAMVVGGLFIRNGLSVPIESVDGEDELTLALPWPGSSGSGAYAIQRENSAAASVVDLYDRMRQAMITLSLHSIHPNFVGTLAEIEALDLEPDQTQFVALRLEEGEDDEYYRWGGTEWIGPFPVRGEGGEPGLNGIGDRFDLAVFAQGKPRDGEVLLRHVFADTPLSFPAGLSLSRASAGVEADSEAVLSLEKNGVEFGTVTFAASGDTGTFAADTQTDFEGGDVLTVIAPSPRDATLADVSITIAGDRGNE